VNAVINLRVLAPRSQLISQHHDKQSSEDDSSQLSKRPVCPICLKQWTMSNIMFLPLSQTFRKSLTHSYFDVKVWTETVWFWTGLAAGT
jgi:hypothetical protein